MQCLLKTEEEAARERELHRLTLEAAAILKLRVIRKKVATQMWTAISIDSHARVSRKERKEKFRERKRHSCGCQKDRLTWQVSFYCARFFFCASLIEQRKKMNIYYTRKTYFFCLSLFPITIDWLIILLLNNLHYYELSSHFKAMKDYRNKKLLLMLRA